MNGERPSRPARRSSALAAAILLGATAPYLPGCRERAAARHADPAPMESTISMQREAFEELERSLAVQPTRRRPVVRGEAGRSVEPGAPFPVDVPPYPGARMIASLEQSSVGRVQLYVTPAPPARVEAFYREHLAAMGWRVTEGADGATGLDFERDRGRLRLSIEARSHGTLLGLAAPLRR